MESEIKQLFFKRRSRVRVFLDLGPGYNYQVLYCRLIENPPPPITAGKLVSLSLSLYIYIYICIVEALSANWCTRKRDKV